MSALGQVRSVKVPRFAEDAVERARLAVVPRQRRGAAPRGPFAILVGALLLGGVAGLLMFNTHMQKNSFAASALEVEAADLHAQVQAMRMEVDDLRDPQRLADRALAMGMLPPDSPAFLDLRTGQVLGDADPSTGRNSFGIDAPATRKPGSLDPEPVVLPRREARRANGAADRGTHARAGTNGDQPGRARP